MMVAGDSCQMTSKASCEKAYEAARQNQGFSGSQSTATSFLTLSSARKYTERLCRECPKAKDAVYQRLALVTGVTKGTTGYYVAEELALCAEMHVVLMGRSAKQLQMAAESIHLEAHARGLRRRSELYRVRMNRNSLKSVANAAEEVEQLCRDHYGGCLHVLCSCSDQIETNVDDTTEEGVEVNLGRNYLAPRMFVDLLLPVLRAAATDDYKPRIVQQAGLGHCLGTDFDPELFRNFPQWGGAPDGGAAKVPDDSDSDSEFGDDSTTTTVSTNTSDILGLEMFHRSTMALIADTIALSREEPMLAAVSFHAGVSSYDNATSIRRSRVGSYFSSPSPSQGARAALRGALDPSLNSEEGLQGAYLHCDGNPWCVSDPTVLNPLTGKVYELEEYAEKVRATGEELCEQFRVDKNWEWDLQNLQSSMSSCSLMLQHEESSHFSMLHAPFSQQKMLLR